MKKSTLFFKVMVLLALLVPWTAWGQNAAWWNNTSNERGSYTISFEEGEAIDLTLDLANSEELNLNGYEFYISTSNGTLPTGINASVTEDQETKISFKGTYGIGLAETYTVKYYVSYSADTKQSGYFTFIFQKKKPVAWDEEKAKGTVKIYVNSANKITKSEPTYEVDEDHRLLINLDNFDGLLDWVYSKSAENQDQPLSNLSEKDLEDFNVNVTWGIPMQNEGMLSVVAKEGLFNNLPKEVKVKIENGGEVGYILLSFAKDNTPIDWTEGEAVGSVIAYVNPEGSITRVEGDGEWTSGRLSIDPEGEWRFAIAEGTDDQPVFSDNFLSKSFTWGVTGNGNLNVYGLDNNESVYNNLPKEVKVKIENGGEVGYILLSFAKDNTPIDWTEGEAVGSVIAYVNPEGSITRVEGDGEWTSGRLSIDPEGEWRFAIAEGTDDQPVFSDNFLSKSFTWGVTGNGNLNVYGLDNNESVYNNLPREVKVQIKNGAETSYILVKFVQDEESENPNEPDWAQGEAAGTVTAYVNPEGSITRVEGDGEWTSGRLSIDPEGEWRFAIAEGTDDQPVFSDNFLSKSFTWGVTGNGNLNVYGLDNNESVYNNLPREVKVQIKNGAETSYILVKFVQDEESENPNEPDWAQGEAAGTVTAYVNPEGSITRVEGDGEWTSGRLSIDPEGEWRFAIAEGTDDQPIFSDNFLSKSFTWGVAGNGNLNVYGLDNNESVYNILPKEVKLQIKNGEQTSYVLIKFVQDDDTWAKEEFAKATVTVYVDAEGNVISTTPTLTVDGKNAINNNGALTISLEEVELAEWAYSAELLDGNLTSNPETSGDDISTSFSLMINGEGNLFVENVEPYVSQLPATVKVKIENEDNVGYLEIAFEKIIVIDPSDIAGGDDDDENGEIDENGNLLGTAEGEKTVYDSETHELAILKVNGLDEPLRVGEDYTVVYTAQESGDLEDDLPYHAGTYNVTITLGDKYITTTGAKEFATTVEITKRDLHLAFSIEENAKIEDLNEKLDLTEGLVICTPENLAQNDKLAGVITATFTIGQEPVDGLYPVYPETIHFENTENFNYTDYNISYDYTDLTGIEHQEEITPDEDGDVEIGDGEGEIPADDPIGGIEYVNPETGEGSAGGYYEKKYRLYLAVKDKNSYYVEDAEADYAAEGLELFSRHDKKTTWAGGSFTVWYEHNKVANEGGYRVFIKRGKHADYEEVKLDEVSGYYQIRNVQSDIYVRLYYGTGFPVANEEITATDARAYAQANKIVVITPEPTDVQVISMAGAVVATDQVTGQREFANLAEGVYIVRMGETVIKLQVRN